MIPYGWFHFRAMFTGGMVESHQHEVQVKGLSSSVLPDIINFVYTDDVEVHNDNVQDLFIAAHLLQLEELCLTCSQHMQVVRCRRVFSPREQV